MEKTTQERKVEEATADIEGACNTIKYQVLNNLDTLLNPDGKPAEKIDPKQLDQLVKGPLMRAITKIGNARMVILKQNSQGRLPS